MDVNIVRTDDQGRHFNQFGQQVHKCKYCGRPSVLGSCDRCNNLETDIRINLEIARKIISAVEGNASAHA